MKQQRSRGIPLDEIRLKLFQDPKRAAFAVRLALKEFENDNDLDVLLDTLRLVAQAQEGGLAGLARKTSYSRQALNEALSSRGNPRLRTFQTMLESMGLRMTVKPVQRRSVRAAV